MEGNILLTGEVKGETGLSRHKAVITHASQKEKHLRTHNTSIIEVNGLRHQKTTWGFPSVSQVQESGHRHTETGQLMTRKIQVLLLMWQVYLPLMNLLKKKN